MKPFLEPLAGGVLIGLGSLLAMIASGKIPGISGVVAKILRPQKNDTLWRVLFLAGLIVGAGLAFLANADWKAFSLPGTRTTLVIAIAGILVGFGARMGGGCTSGHGVCGMGALAKDAVVYTLTFMTAAALTVFTWNLFIS